jgi:hypothetical protein
LQVHILQTLSSSPEVPRAGDLAAIEVLADRIHTLLGRSDVKKRLTIAMLSVYLSGAAQPKVTVRVYNLAKVPDGILSEALSAGKAILAQAGIESEWATREVESCDPAVFTIRVLRGTSRVHGVPEAFGAALLTRYAEPPNRADAFYGSVLEYATTPRETAWLLANVMAHEVGHLLLGSKHSPRGLMRGSWDKEDIRAALVMPLKLEKSEAADLRAAAARLSCPVAH